MIIKKYKGGLTLLTSIILVIAILIFESKFSKNLKFKLNFEDRLELTQKLLAMDPGFHTANSPTDFFNRLVKNFPNFIYFKTFGHFDRPQIDRIDIDINFLNFKTLEDDRVRAKEFMVLVDPKKVPATIRYKDKSFKAKVRLKGDLGEHWKSPTRMSLRVDLNGKNSIFGFKSFSIHKPKARQHPYDQIFQSIRKESLSLSSNHTYARVYLNGTNWGVMNIEEQMTKEFLEKREHKESLIFKFGNEDSWVYKRSTPKDAFLKGYRLSDPFLKLKVYKSSKYLSNELYRKWFSYVSNSRMLDRSTHLYDIDKFSQLLILGEVWNNRHTMAHSNMRYYFNPYTLRLEPITTDQGNFISWKKGRGGSKFDPMNYKLYREITSTSIFDKNFDKNMSLISSSIKSSKKYAEYFKSFFPLDEPKTFNILELNLDLVKNNPVKFLPLTSDKKFSVDDKSITITDILKNQTITDKHAKFLHDHIFARHYTDGRIDIFNLLPKKINVKHIKSKNNTINVNKELDGYDYKSYEPSYSVNTSLTGIKDGEITIVTDFNGHTKNYKIPFSIYPEVYNPLLLRNENEFKFITKKSPEEFIIKPGKWNVKKPMYIKGLLTIQPGVELIFSPNSYIIIEGSINAASNTKDKIIFRPEKKDWKGVYVFESGNLPKSKSKLKNVDFIKTTNLNDGILDLTGAISFYNTDVEMRNVTFDSTVAEDSLNIVKSKFMMNNVTILSTISDGLDSDFSSGVIKNSTFKKIGGDALDFSGSNVSIISNNINDVKDKAISIGEESIVNVKGGKINDVSIGIVSKDGSKAIIFNVDIKNYDVAAAMTYKKKSFYGAPSLKINNVNIDGMEPYIREQNTELLVDGENVKISKVDIKTLTN